MATNDRPRWRFFISNLLIFAPRKDGRGGAGSCCLRADQRLDDYRRLGQGGYRRVHVQLAN